MRLGAKKDFTDLRNQAALALLLIFLALKQAEKRRAMRPKSPPCLSEASLGAVPRRPRSTGHRSGNAGSAGVRRGAFGSFWPVKRNSGAQRTKRFSHDAARKWIVDTPGALRLPGRPKQRQQSRLTQQEKTHAVPGMGPVQHLHCTQRRRGAALAAFSSSWSRKPSLFTSSWSKRCVRRGWSFASSRLMRPSLLVSRVAKRSAALACWRC